MVMEFIVLKRILIIVKMIRDPAIRTRNSVHSYEEFRYES
jgi:hypothetical protein